MKKLVSLVLALLMASVPVTGASADVVNRQISPLDSDSSWMPMNMDIQYVEVAEDSRDDSLILFFVYMKGWISRYSFSSYSSDYVSINIDSNADGVLDFYISTAKETYPANRVGLDIPVLDIENDRLAPECEASTWMNDGYSSTDSNWIGFQVKKDCLNLSSSASVYAYSKYLTSYADFTDEFLFETGVVNTIVPAFGWPAKGSAEAFKVRSPGDAPDDLVALSPKILDSVFQVFCKAGTGSGWAANATLNSAQLSAGYKTVVVTNNHVVEDCLQDGSVEVMDSTGATHTGVIFANDPDNDLAGILLKKSFPVLEWAGEKPAQAWWVGVLGAPRSIYGYLSTGLVSLVSSPDQLLGISAAVNPGNSGGPAFDRTGRVIGIVTWKLSDAEGIAIAQGTPRLCVKIISCSNVDTLWATNLSASPEVVETPVVTNPAVAHLKGHGPIDGEFSAWTKVLANGTQMKFYAKYLQPGQKVQFMVQNSAGVYEQVAWKRVTESDLTSDGAYTNLQNHVYFIRTIDLKPGKNRVRILVDGEIVWGTKTYSLK